MGAKPVRRLRAYAAIRGGGCSPVQIAGRLGSLVCWCCHESPPPRCFMEKSDEQELAKIKAWLIERNPYGPKLKSFDDMAREIFSVRRAYYPEDALVVNQPSSPGR